MANVADVFVLIGEIQRTWSYLEPLFIGSEEVKRELPEDAKRFEGIDVNVKNELKTCWEIKNVDQACNQEGLLSRLENILEQLEICKKSLSDFLDGRRRQFPRYYFTSEADLLDILSNGSTPEKVLKHTAKVYLSCKTLTLDTLRNWMGCRSWCRKCSFRATCSFERKSRNLPTSYFGCYEANFVQQFETFCYSLS